MANITINQTPTRVQYSASSAQTVFSYTFPIKADGDLKVYQRAAAATPNDGDDLLTITTDYTVTGANTAAGGTVVLVTGATLNDVVTIVGDKPIDRSAIYDQSVTLSKADLNNDFNDNVMYDKQIETIQNQLSPKYNRSELISDSVREDNLFLPILNDGYIWIGRGDNGDSPDDIVATAIGDFDALGLLSVDYIVGTANPALPNAQPLGGLGTGLVYSTDSGTTGTVTTLTLGGGLTTDGTTIYVTGSGITWTNVAINTQTAIGNGYITSNAGTLDLTLPATAAVGSMVQAINLTGDYAIKQNAGQSVQFNTSTTTAGVGGSITTTELGQAIELVCVTADTVWMVLSSTGTTFTIV